MSTINLLPTDYLQRRSQQRANTICMVLFAVVVASIGGASLVSERASRNTREVCNRINASYADAARLIDEVHQLEKRKREMLQKAEMSASLMERLPRSYVLSILANALPPGASIVSLEMNVRPVKPAGGSAKKLASKFAAAAAARAKQKALPPPTLAVTLNIKGKAVTDVQVARFIASLAKHELMEMVDLSYSKQQGDAKAEAAREFRLTARLKPNADALDALQQPAEEEAQAAAPKAGPVRTGGGA